MNGLNNRNTSLNKILNYFQGWDSKTFNNVIFNNTMSDKIEFLKVVNNKLKINDIYSNIIFLDEYRKSVINQNDREIIPLDCVNYEIYANTISFLNKNFKNYNNILKHYRNKYLENKGVPYSILDEIKNISSNQNELSFFKIGFPDGEYGLERTTLAKDKMIFEIFKFKNNFNFPSIKNFLDQWDLSHREYQKNIIKSLNNREKYQNNNQSVSL